MHQTHPAHHHGGHHHHPHGGHAQPASPPRPLTPAEHLDQYTARVEQELRPRVTEYTTAAQGVRTAAQAADFLRRHERTYLEINHYLEQAEDKVDAVDSAGDHVVRAHRKRVGEGIRALSRELHGAKARLDQLAGAGS